jgi:hypothetical protein
MNTNISLKKKIKLFNVTVYIHWIIGVRHRHMLDTLCLQSDVSVPVLLHGLACYIFYVKFLISYYYCSLKRITFIGILNYWRYTCITDKLPYSIRILLESAIRNCDNFQVTKEDVEKIIDWENTSTKQVEIPFKPARVLLQVNFQLLKSRYIEIFILVNCNMLSSFWRFSSPQDFTGVPAVVDLACMRDAMNKLGSDSNKINPLVFIFLITCTSFCSLWIHWLQWPKIFQLCNNRWCDICTLISYLLF